MIIGRTGSGKTILVLNLLSHRGVKRLTLNERLLTRMKQEMGDDPTTTMILTMFEGNLLSIPEVELKEHIQRYCSVLTDLLLDKP